MDLVKKLQLISRIGLLIAGIIFLCLTIFANGGQWTLIAALVCITIGNLLSFTHPPKGRSDTPKI